MKIKQVLKKSPLVRKAFYTLLNYSPHSIIFRNNLKSVDEFDKKNGTNFGGRLYWDEIGTVKERANDYSPSPKDLVAQLKRHMFGVDDCIVDLGCGKGYAMYQLLQFPFKKVGG